MRIFRGGVAASSNDGSQERKVFAQLMEECQSALPVSRLTEKLRRSLEDFPRRQRQKIVSQTVEGCAPLFLACKNGCADVAEYLLTQCAALVEQRGLYEVLEEGVSHHVTPLWCAAVAGRLAVVKVLLRHGADVDAASDSGSTPVRSACYIVRHGLDTAHLDIIKCLVRAGADVKRPNHFGGTCLINSVQSPELVRFLLKSGVDVNAKDVQHKTALHYAVQEGRLQTTKLLLGAGADPAAKSKYGDDVLQTACLKGSLAVFNHLLEYVGYPPERIAAAFELMGSTFLLDMHDVGSALFFWRKAMEIRHEGRYARYPKADDDLFVHPVLNLMEVNSMEELDALAGDTEALKLQALLVTERVLGPGHKDTIFRYMYAGAAHADANAYGHCVALWNYALQLKVRKETLLSCDTSFTARAVVQLYANVLLRQRVMTSAATIGETDIRFQDVLRTARLIGEGLPEAVSLLAVRPMCKAQRENFDIVLTTWVHLVLILLRLADSDGGEDDNNPRLASVRSEVTPVLRLKPSTQYGDSPLHLAVSSSATLRSKSFLDEDDSSSSLSPLFPSRRLALFLLSCGSLDVHERNHRFETPLHTACQPDNFRQEVVRALLESGAHADVPDDVGICPQDLLPEDGGKLNLVAFCSLKCLAARVVLRDLLLVDLSPSAVPSGVADCILLHARRDHQEYLSG